MKTLICFIKTLAIQLQISDEVLLLSYSAVTLAQCDVRIKGPASVLSGCCLFRWSSL